MLHLFGCLKDTCVLLKVLQISLLSVLSRI